MAEPENQEAIKALANPVRRQILELLRNGEMSVNALVAKFDIARPGISRHLRVLREAGLVIFRTEHNVRFYSLDPEEMGRLRSGFDAEFRDFWRPQGASGEAKDGILAKQEFRASYEVEVSVELPASPSLVYRYLTDEDLFRSWVGEDAFNTAEVGGTVGASSAFGARLVGEYMAIAPERFLAIRLVEPLDPDGNLYTLQVIPTDGGTRLQLRHYVRDENVARLVTMAWGETWKLLRRKLAETGDA